MILIHSSEKLPAKVLKSYQTGVANIEIHGDGRAHAVIRLRDWREHIHAAKQLAKYERGGTRASEQENEGQSPMELEQEADGSAVCPGAEKSG